MYMGPDTLKAQLVTGVASAVFHTVREGTDCHTGGRPPGDYVTLPSDHANNPFTYPSLSPQARSLRVLSKTDPNVSWSSWEPTDYVVRQKCGC